MSYTIQGDGIGVEIALPLPWSKAEVAALEAFLLLSPKERMAALVKLADNDDKPGRWDETIPQAQSGIKELDEKMDTMLDTVGKDEAAKIADLIGQLLKR